MGPSEEKLKALDAEFKEHQKTPEARLNEPGYYTQKSLECLATVFDEESLTLMHMIHADKLLSFPAKLGCIRIVQAFEYASKRKHLAKEGALAVWFPFHSAMCSSEAWKLCKKWATTSDARILKFVDTAGKRSTKDSTWEVLIPSEADMKKESAAWDTIKQANPKAMLVSTFANMYRQVERTILDLAVPDMDMFHLSLMSICIPFQPNLSEGEKFAIFQFHTLRVILHAQQTSKAHIENVHHDRSAVIQEKQNILDKEIQQYHDRSEEIDKQAKERLSVQALGGVDNVVPSVTQVFAPGPLACLPAPTYTASSSTSSVSSSSFSSTATSTSASTASSSTSSVTTPSAQAV
jgi:hypothetical protein